MGRVIDVGSDSVELNEAEFELHKHKLEGTESDVKPVANNGNNKIDPNAVGLGNRAKINRQQLTRSKQLDRTDAIKQHLLCFKPGLEVFLPSNPIEGDGFTVKNSDSSTQGFVCNGIEIFRGEFYEVCFDGVEWVEF